MAAEDADTEALLAEAAALTVCVSMYPLVAASDVLVGVERPVIVAPVIVPPVIVAVDVNAPEMVAQAMIGVVSVLLVKV